MVLFLCEGFSWSALAFLALASLSDSLLLAAGSSVLLGIHGLLLVSLASMDHALSRCCPVLHFLDLMLNICHCDGDWFLFWEHAVVYSLVLLPLCIDVIYVLSFLPYVLPAMFRFCYWWLLLCYWLLLLCCCIAVENTTWMALGRTEHLFFGPCFSSVFP